MVGRINIDDETDMELGELGGGLVTKDGKLVNPDGSLAARKAWKSDREHRRERSASVSASVVASPAARANAAFASLDVRRKQTTGYWDTACEYNLLTPAAGAGWDGSRRKELRLSGFNSSGEAGAGGGNLIMLVFDDEGEVCVQNFGTTYVVPNLQTNLWAGVGARDQGVGTNIGCEAADVNVLHTREGRVLPLTQDPRGARLLHLAGVIVPSALGAVKNGTRYDEIDWAVLPRTRKYRPPLRNAL